MNHTLVYDYVSDCPNMVVFKYDTPRTDDACKKVLRAVKNTQNLWEVLSSRTRKSHLLVCHQESDLKAVMRDFRDNLRVIETFGEFIDTLF